MSTITIAGEGQDFSNITVELDCGYCRKKFITIMKEAEKHLKKCSKKSKPKGK